MEKKDAFKFTGEDAEYYDQYLGPLLFEPYGRYLASKINADGFGSVLEIACGTGRVTRHIRRALPGSVKLVATDISNDMLAVAKRSLPDDDIQFMLEDAQQLSFADNSFDLVVCQFGIMFLPDKKRGLDEMYRVLKPGGKVMVFTWDDTLNMPLLKLTINDMIVPIFAGEDPTRFFTPFSLHDPAQLEQFLTGSGFKKAKSERIALPSGAVSAGDVVNGLFRKHMFGKEVLAKDASLFEPLARKLENNISAQLSRSDRTFDLSAFLTIGVK